MEAKNTVMTYKQQVECSHNPNLELREEAMCQAQAEISFKAGYQAGIEKASYILPSKFKKVRQAGIREVVEWIDQVSYINYGQGKPYEAELCFERFKWQAKLKEWGIKQ